MERRLLAVENIKPISNAICKNIETRIHQSLNTDQRRQVQVVLADQIRACIRDTPGPHTPSGVNRTAAAETLKRVLPMMRFGHPAMATSLITPTRREQKAQATETPTTAAAAPPGNLDTLLANILQEREVQNTQPVNYMNPINEPADPQEGLNNRNAALTAHGDDQRVFQLRDQSLLQRREEEQQTALVEFQNAMSERVVRPNESGVEHEIPRQDYLATRPGEFKPAIRREDQPDEDTKPTEDEYIIPQASAAVAPYYERSSKLYIHSVDRDWTQTGENRQNFSVRIGARQDTSTVRSSKTATTANNIRNVVGLDILRVNIPNESLDVLAQSLSGAGTQLETANTLSALKYPYINLVIDEFEDDGDGTNPYLSKSVATLQYEVDWVSDSNLGKGWLSFIPTADTATISFFPSMLNSLNSLSIRLTDPDGRTLSADQDSYRIRRMQAVEDDGTRAPFANDTPHRTLNPSGSGGEFLWIELGQYAPRHRFQRGHLIKFTDYEVVKRGGSTLTDATKLQFETFINRREGHLIAQTGVVTYSAPNATNSEAPNSVGYINAIIIRLPQADPSTGTVGRAFFGTKTEEQAELLEDLRSAAAESGWLLNTSQQTFFTFNIRTRERDTQALLEQTNITQSHP